MDTTRINVKYMAEKCLSFLLLAGLLCRPALCGEIHDAANEGNLEKVKALLKDNPDLVFSRDNDGETPLHRAAYWGYKEMAIFLIFNKADVNAKDIKGQTPLHKAADQGRKPIVELLLACKGDVNAKDNDGWTPMHSAAGGKRNPLDNLIKMIHAKQAEDKAGIVDRVTDVKVYDGRGGYKSLRQAETYGGQAALDPAANGPAEYTELIALLIEYGGDANARDKQGETPSDLAEMKGHAELVELFRLQNTTTTNFALALARHLYKPLAQQTTGGERPSPPYPPLAKELHQEGVVTLRITVDDAGEVQAIKVGQSSGFPLLDHSAMDFVRVRWTFPSGRGARTYEVSINYKLVPASP